MPFCPKGKTAVNQCFKYLVMIGSFLHLICAVGMIAVGSWAIEEGNKFFGVKIEDFYDVLTNVAVMFILCGAIMAIINICGFIGALRENSLLLKIFYIALLVIFLLELIGGVLLVVLKDRVLEVFSREIKESYVDDYLGGSIDKDNIMDFFQEKYHCCGINDYKDWNSNAYFNCSDTNLSPVNCDVPYSCCKEADDLTSGLINTKCGGGALEKDSATVEKIWTQGCVPALVALAADNLPLIGGICIAVAIPQLMGIFLGRRLAEQIQYQWTQYRKAQRQQHQHHGRR